MTQSAVGIAKLNRKFSQAIVAEDGGRLVGLLNAAIAALSAPTGEKIRPCGFRLACHGVACEDQLMISKLAKPSTW